MDSFPNRTYTPQVGGMDTGDWRTQLQPESRQRIINKIMETFKRHLHFPGEEGLHDLTKIAVRFEEEMYTAATSQSDYLRKISLKMLTMESKSQNAIPNSLPTDSAGNSTKAPDPASYGMQSQVHDQGPSLPIPLSANQPQASQQMVSQTIQNNVASADDQGFANSQRLMQERQQVVPQQQSQDPQLLYQQQQLQQQLLKQRQQQYWVLQQQQQQQRHLMSQQNNLSSVHQQQLGPQTNVSGLQQQQLFGTQSGNSSMRTNQHSVHMLQQNAFNLLPSQGQQSHPQAPQQQLMSQIQSLPAQLQQQLSLQQQPNPLQRDMQ